MLFKFATLIWISWFSAMPGQAQKGAEVDRPQFRITCQFSDADETVAAPLVTVFEGQTANIVDQTQTPFVTNVTVIDGEIRPEVEVLNEGFDIKLVARNTADGMVMMQVTAVKSNIVDVVEAQVATAVCFPDGKLPTLQFPQLNVQSIRAGRTMLDGGKTELHFADGTGIKLSVERVK